VCLERFDHPGVGPGSLRQETVSRSIEKEHQAWPFLAVQDGEDLAHHGHSAHAPYLQVDHDHVGSHVMDGGDDFMGVGKHLDIPAANAEDGTDMVGHPFAIGDEESPGHTETIAMSVAGPDR